MRKEEIYNLICNIRVQLHIPLDLSEFSVSHKKIDNQTELKEIGIPWYINDGNEVLYDDTNAKPLTVSRILDNLGALKQQKRDTIAKYALCFKACDEPVHFNIPVYAIGDKYLVLDGCHRTIALVLSGIPFELGLLVIKGPICNDILPDLKHWIA